MAGSAITIFWRSLLEGDWSLICICYFVHHFTFIKSRFTSIHSTHFNWVTGMQHVEKVLDASYGRGGELQWKRFSQTLRRSDGNRWGVEILKDNVRTDAWLWKCRLVLFFMYMCGSEALRSRVAICFGKWSTRPRPQIVMLLA